MFKLSKLFKNFCSINTKPLYPIETLIKDYSMKKYTMDEASIKDFHKDL